MDEADREIEMEKDPFLAAGIDIPEELPYKDQSGKVSRTTSIASKASMRMKTNISQKKGDQDKEDLLKNTHKKNLNDSNIEKNDQTEVTIEKSALNSNNIQNSDIEQNSLNHEMKIYPELSLEPPTPTSSVPYINTGFDSGFDSTNEPNGKLDQNLT